MWEKIKSLANGWIQPRMVERPLIFHGRVQGVLGGVAGRGFAPSRGTYVAVEKEMRAELKLRGEIVFEGFKRALESSDCEYPAELERNLIAVLESRLVDESIQIWGETNYVREACGVKDAALTVQFRWDALNRISADFNLLCEALRKEKAVKERQAPLIQNNFNAPVASVQTGTGASAAVIQWNDQSQKEALISALKALEVEVGKLARPEQVELSVVITDAKAELCQPKPNGFKVAGLLAGMAAAVSAVADVKPAYDNVKQAASFFGINLP